MNMQQEKQHSPAPSRDEPHVSYVELHFKNNSGSRIGTNGDRMTSTYAGLNFGKTETLINEDEDPTIVSRAGELRVTTPAAAREQQSKVKIRNRPNRLICLLCLVMSSLIVIVAGLTIHGIQRDLRHKFTELESKLRSVNETKAQICALLTSGREQTCSKDCVTNTKRRYYVSAFATSFPRAMRECSNRDSGLLEINSRDEESFVSRFLVARNLAYWIGQCAYGNDASGVLYKVSSGNSSCIDCKSNGRSDNCLEDKYRFICEMCVPFCPDIPEKINVLCQQPPEPL